MSVIDDIPHFVPDVSLVRLPERASHGIAGLAGGFHEPSLRADSRCMPFMHSEDIFFLVNIPLLSDGILSA
ncbi:hypothetical protein PH562_28725 [Rhizobium sp. CNPSo 4062]|uniref:hypothetical protein n=1 Tax=Rhizobium sp. CNPSo 4062 TaxID=3021410 RepID=UPI00254B2D03|nr:hypothetical protein [Rhizobium sp. CNPSo 4062]MDK4706262.1 hypothetical protein [Rhizobium sp. CNPSo 4062]